MLLVGLETHHGNLAGFIDKIHGLGTTFGHQC
jgi:hypothetical protein